MSQDFSRTLLKGNALICLGSNVTSKVGGPADTLRAAFLAIDAKPLKILASSRFYLSPFVPKGSQPDVVNAVVRVETSLTPRQVLSCLHQIEDDFDRKREERWGGRTLDLDLLTMDQKILPDQSTLREWVELSAENQRKVAPSELILPHPRLQDRAFVLVPACEIAPEWMHPYFGQSLAELRDKLPKEDLAAIRPLET